MNIMRKILKKKEHKIIDQRILFYNFSHQIRAPLNVILGFSENLLTNRHLIYDQLEPIAAINRSGKLLLAMINDVLDIENIQAGRVALETSSIDIYDLLRRISSGIKPLLDSKGLFINIEILEGTTRHVVADETRLAQMFLSFLREAVEPAKIRGVTMQVSTKHKKDNLILMSNITTIETGITDKHGSDIPTSFEPVLDQNKNQNKNNLKPGLVLGALLARLMSGRAMRKKREKNTIGFLFEVAINENSANKTHDDATVICDKFEKPPTPFENISVLPDKLVCEMQDAVKKARFDLLSELINQAETYDSNLAIKLRDLSRCYNYESILALLESKNEF